MKPLYYVPSWLKCPACKFALLTETKEISDDGKVTLVCLSSHCDRKHKRMEVKLPSLAYVDLESE